MIECRRMSTLSCFARSPARDSGRTLKPMITTAVEAEPACVGDDLERFAGIGDTLQSEDFNRRCGTAFIDRLAAVIKHRAHLAVDLADDERVAQVQSALLDEHRGDRAATSIKFGFENHTGCQ